MTVSQKQRWAKEHLKLKDEIDTLKAENKRLNNALEFYARRIIDNHILITEIINENGKDSIPIIKNLVNTKKEPKSEMLKNSPNE
jgi:hypothetical protein